MKKSIVIFSFILAFVSIYNLSNATVYRVNNNAGIYTDTLIVFSSLSAAYNAASSVSTLPTPSS